MVVGSGGGGVLLHEAVGHGLESDFNRQGTSLYSGRVGERVASELVTIYDDGNLHEERGSISIDDEGAPGAAQSAGRERHAARLHARSPQRERLMGVGLDRQRPASIVPRSAAAAHVQHLHARAATQRRGDRRFDQARHLRQIVCGRASRDQPEAISSSWWRGYLIENGKITAPVRTRRSSATDPT